MSDSEVEAATFESTEDVGDLAYPVQASALRIGGHVLIQNRPCKIAEMHISKTGKHGHAKVTIVAIDIFTDRKYETMSPSTHNLMVPHVRRQDYPLLDIDDDGFVSLLLPSGETKEDVRVPGNELGERLAQDFAAGKTLTVSLLCAMREQAIVSYACAQ